MKHQNKILIFRFVLLVLFVLIMGLSQGAITSSSSGSSSNSIIGSALLVNLLNQNPDPAYSGDIFEARIDIQNIGDEATKNLVTEFVPEYPFEKIENENYVFNVGSITKTLSGDNSKIIKFKIKVNKDAKSGTYSLPILLYEEGKRDVTSKYLFNINVQSKETAEIIFIDKTVLIPGNQDTLVFTIKNVGSAPLQDLVFSWENSNDIILPVGSDNTKYVKFIDVNDSIELKYNVIADTNANPGLYKLKLQLTYKDTLTNTEKTINTIAGIYVGGITDFDIAYSESNGNEMSFTIANVGSNPAYSVSIIIPNQAGWLVSGSNSAIIGNLNTGDYTVVSFSLKQNQQMTNQQMANALNRPNFNNTENRNFLQNRTRMNQSNLKMQIAYTDTMGKRQNLEKEVNMLTFTNTTRAIGTNFANTQSFRRQQQSFFVLYKNYIIAGLIIVLVVISLSLRAKYKKQKLLNPNYKFIDLFRKKRKLK